MNRLVDSIPFKEFDKTFQENIDFLRDFSNLILYSGRLITFVCDKKVNSISTQILEGAVQTLESIRLCCSIGSITDANILIRKFRDDLILYAYFISVAKNRKIFKQDVLDGIKLDTLDDFHRTFSEAKINIDLTDDEKAVAAWLNNEVAHIEGNVKNKLSFKNYMKVLKEDPKIEKLLQNYNLIEYWERLRGILNDYVHSNGRKFSAHNLVKPHYNQEISLKSVHIRVKNINIFFLVLIIMVDASLIRSEDIFDYLEEGKEPPDGCQYEIAPFVKDFIDKEVVRIHPELKQFLKDFNSHGMKID